MSGVGGRGRQYVRCWRTREAVNQVLGDEGGSMSGVGGRGRQYVRC